MMMKYGILLTLIMLTSNAISQSGGANKIDTTSKQIRFFGIDYSYGFPQTPVSEKYNMNGITSSFSSFNADISWPWFIDKKKENSILLTKINYTNILSTTRVSDSVSKGNNAIPEYLLYTPDIHNFGISTLFIQNFPKAWELVLGIDLLVSTDAKSFQAKEDINSIGLFLIQKSVGQLKIGVGGILYSVNKQVTSFPLINLTYMGKWFEADIQAPVSLKTSLKFNSKTKLGIESGLVIHGFNVDYSYINYLQQPNYIENNGFDLSIIFDRRIYETLHLKFALGYFYREITYLKDHALLDKLIYNDGGFVEVSFYSTF
jgi:hypothetical protein